MLLVCLPYTAKRFTAEKVKTPGSIVFLAMVYKGSKGFAVKAESKDITETGQLLSNLKLSSNFLLFLKVNCTALLICLNRLLFISIW